MLHSVRRTFLNSAEDQLGVFAQYYGLPQLSLRDVVWHETEAGAPGFALDDIMLPNGGNIHPNERGHGCPDKLAKYIQRVYSCQCILPDYSTNLVLDLWSAPRDPPTPSQPHPGVSERC